MSSKTFEPTLQYDEFAKKSNVNLESTLAYDLPSHSVNNHSKPNDMANEESDLPTLAYDVGNPSANRSKEQKNSTKQTTSTNFSDLPTLDYDIPSKKLENSNYKHSVHLSTESDLPTLAYDVMSPKKHPDLPTLAYEEDSSSKASKSTSREADSNVATLAYDYIPSKKETKLQSNKEPVIDVSTNLPTLIYDSPTKEVSDLPTLAYDFVPSSSKSEVKSALHSNIPSDLPTLPYDIDQIPTKSKAKINQPSQNVSKAISSSSANVRHLLARKGATLQPDDSTDEDDTYKIE